MSPVGTGLVADVQPSASALFLPSSLANRQSSIWNGGRADIFSDPRAAKIGDVVTVQIAINDSGQAYENQIGRRALQSKPRAQER